MESTPITIPTTKKKNPIWRWIGVVCLVVLIGLGIGYVIYQEPIHQYIHDFYVAKNYEPSSEMVEMKKELNLTKKGEFLFDASQPRIEEKVQFNYLCDSHDPDLSILGCYLYDQQSIHVYHISMEELNGIMESTCVHELMHAAWDRLSEKQKDELIQSMDEAMETCSVDHVREELTNYRGDEYYNELHSRLITEVENLPSELKEYYSLYFNDVDSIVHYYQNYNEPLDELVYEMTTLEEKIDAKTMELEELYNAYLAKQDELNERITAFNHCADTVGCFINEYEFYSVRNTLVADQEAINADYDQLLVVNEELNGYIDEYNQLVARSGEFLDAMNSNAIPLSDIGDQL